ncbi:hypothetical protein BBO01nite_50110 [Brevibacillus borstelensis]|nr:hypothetical protein BBO01nite_50110 [Brevibacillus borstelensis]
MEKWYVLMLDEKGKRIWVETTDLTLWNNGKIGSPKVHNKKLCSIVAVFPAK